MSDLRLGLWKNTSKNGNDYLKGTDKEAGISYFVFKNDDGRRSLSTTDATVENSPFKKVCDLEERTDKNGNSFLTGGEYAIFVNGYKEEGSNQPDFNLVATTS